MKLCILEDRYDGSTSPMAGHDPPSEPEHYFGAHEWERHFLTKADGVRRVMELAREGYDAVNLRRAWLLWRAGKQRTAPSD